MLGFININKPKGMSSAYAVGKVKKLFHCPCGHMGTLDPLASGVLPIGIYKTSRLFQYMLSKQKEYIAEFTFGYLTDTLDCTGKVLEENKRIPEKQEVLNILPLFIGEIDQVPPKYSAKCISGNRGYQLARRGVDFTLPPKRVKIFNIELIENVGATFKFIITCGGGTYIRALARDMGEKLNTVCTMDSLIRSKCGIFTLENSVEIEDLTSIENIESKIIKPEMAVSFEKIFLTKDQERKILNGIFPNLGIKDDTYRVFGESGFLGVGSSKDGVLKIDSYVR